MRCCWRCAPLVLELVSFLPRILKDSVSHVGISTDNRREVDVKNMALLARCSTPYFITGFRTTTILLSFVLYCKLKQSHFDKIVGRLHFTATAFDNRRVQAERMISMLTKFPRG